MYTLPFYFLIVMFVSNYVLSVAFVIFKHFPDGGWLAFIYLFAGLIVVLLFLKASFAKPGYIVANPTM